MRALAAVVWLVTAAGCGASPQPADAPVPGAVASPRASETPPSPMPTPASSPVTSPQPSTETEPEGLTSVSAWFARTTAFARTGGTRLSVEPVAIALDEPTLGVARAAMEALVSTDPPDPALSTLAPPGTRVLGAQRDGTVVTVDLSAEVQATPAGSEGEQAFAQQLAHTAAQFDGVEAVRLLVEGDPIEELWGHLDWSQPIAPEPFAESPVVITEPAWGAEVPAGALTVRGEAQVNEGTLALQLLGPDGAVVEEAMVTATCGTTCRGTWSHTFAIPLTSGTVRGPSTPLTSGTWSVTAASTDDSEGEGPGPFVARVEVTFG